MNVIKQLEMAISLGPTLVTVLFIALFLATLVWIYRPGSRRFYDQQAHLPLEDGQPAAETAPGAPHIPHLDRRASEKANG